jgi:hypothetical protein
MRLAFSEVVGHAGRQEAYLLYQNEVECEEGNLGRKNGDVLCTACLYKTIFHYTLTHTPVGGQQLSKQQRKGSC